MTEILITSSVLILALLVLRKLFRNTLSRRVQYALWGLVLLRLLAPVSLPAVDFSVLTRTKPVEHTVSQRITARPVYIPVARGSLAEHPTAPDLTPERAEIAEGESVWVAETDRTAVQYKRLSVEALLSLVWMAGSGLAAAFLLAVNVRFWLRLRRLRKDYPVEGCPLQVYLVEEGLTSPCLFGLFRPAVYLTPAALSSPERLRHVLAHEMTHARHLDHLWTLLRGVCLAVYWFDPLVWAASAAAKTDCELACDEGTLARLGERERIPYGQTLLSLIPVQRAGNPMLAATTMAAGKKQLKDRFTRIARRPRQFAAAAVAVALLAGMVSACTFTGAVTPEVVLPDPSEVEDVALRALTGEELYFFNEEFFNGADAQDQYASGPEGDRYYSIRNQFANPLNIYEKPEDINLYELLYCEGTTDFSDVERQAAFGDGLDCASYKLTVGDIDQILTQYAGLTFSQTNQVGMENFTYLTDYDAYYNIHGDTNYPGDLLFSVGTREGRTVKLYQNSTFSTGWYCVTMEEQEDGSYWFVSNQESEKPAIPTPMPAGEPEAVISLDDLRIYEAPEITIEPRVGDFVDTYENRLVNWDINGHNVVVYRDTSGVINAAIREEDTMNVFLTGLSENTSVFFFHDLFGHGGFTVSYEIPSKGAYPESVTDYFYFAEDGMPVLLVRSYDGGIMALDLDGDGTDELVSDRQMFVQRDGQLYTADAGDWSDMVLSGPGYLFYHWDQYSKCLQITAYRDSDEGHAVEYYLYFDGEQLLLYQGEGD